MTEGTTPHEEQFGRLERLGDQVVIRFSRRLPHPPRKVWRALTEPEHLSAWFPTTIEGTGEAGALLHFGLREMEAEPFDGEMRAFEPPTLMEFRWGDEILRFELTERTYGCALTFTVTFDEIGKAARDAAGWHASLELLDYAVTPATAPWSAPNRWRQVHRAYVERFGPEASIIGPPEEWERVRGSEGRD